ncbi:MAG: hypothetical protein HY557_05735 [Euryarchaeota archaeon]|nr:hypothetical protein [Euryarchaeota archaeon]
MRSYRGAFSGFLAMAMGLSAILAPVPSAVGQQAITEDVSRTESLFRGEWVAYSILILRDKVANIRISGADAALDFYVFTLSQFQDYINPDVPSFQFVAGQEDARSFSYSLSDSGRILVIDNAFVSASGASPTGSATYILTITYPNAPSPVLVGGIVLIIIVVLVVVISFILWRRRARSVPPSMEPPVQPPKPPSPPAL